MKGIILAGGFGTRLYPLTKVISKQILPVYDKPMIYYPLSILMLSDIRDILIISSPMDIECYKELLGDGSALGLSLKYKIQDEPRGIADAFHVGKEFIGQNSVALILGDNIFYGKNLADYLQIVRKKITDGALIFGYFVDNPTDYGVIELSKQGHIISIEEKPKKPKSKLAIPGLYFYDNDVVDIVNNLRPSIRGELEITDVNKYYMKRNRLKVEILNEDIVWFDTGNYQSLLEASTYIRDTQDKDNQLIACIEEIAYKKRYIDKNQLLEISMPYMNTEYGQYLAKL